MPAGRMRDPPALLASYWTLAGDGAPRRGAPKPSERSLAARIEAASAAGFTGMGLDHADLVHCAAQYGINEMRRMFDAAGIVDIELEMLRDWFAEGPRRDHADGVRRDLLHAAEALAARHIKVGVPSEGESWPLDVLAGEFAGLCREAADAGTRVGMEPVPYGALRDLGAALAVIEAAGATNGGLVIDIWHVVRGGTSFDEIRRIPAPLIVGAELNDADAEPVGELRDDTLDRRRLCGEGAFDIPGFIAALRDTGYDGPYGIEIISEQHRQRALADAAQLAYATARRCFEALPEP